jgi:hypothetical protein
MEIPDHVLSTFASKLVSFTVADQPYFSRLPPFLPGGLKTSAVLALRLSRWPSSSHHLCFFLVPQICLLSDTMHRSHP